MKHYILLVNTVLLLTAFIPSLVTAQEWQTMGDIEEIPDNIRIYELYPDTTEDKIFIGGSFLTFDTIPTHSITAFDGQHYEYLSPKINNCSNGGCIGVSSIVRYKGDIIASSIRSATYETNPQIIGIGRWDANAWHPLGGGVASHYDDTYHYYDPAPLFDFCIADDLLYVAGYINYVDNEPIIGSAGMAVWNGTQWHTFDVPKPPVGEAILATSIAKYKGNIFLGGNFDALIGEDNINDLIQYDGSSWSKVGDGLIDGWTNLHDLEVFQDKLIVAGYFNKEDGNPGSSIMSWDGEHWDDMGGGICTPFGAIDDLFVYKDKLYVAGYFDCIGGIEAHNVAVWDGAKWCSIGNSIFDKAVHAIAVWRDTVYIGGSFLKINGQPSRMFARYVGDHSTDVCSEPVSTTVESYRAGQLPISPNPVHDQITIQGTFATNWRLFNAAGQEVTVLVHSTSAANAQQTLLSVQALPTGLYYLQVLGQMGLEMGKFVKM